MSCECCPFACTDKSEEVQNYGCLPTPYDIIQMKRKSGHNWACHSNEKVLCCQGFKTFTEREHTKRFHGEMDTSIGNLISYETWCHQGEEAAIKEADNK